jgi:hypothetical protein
VGGHGKKEDEETNGDDKQTHCKPRTELRDLNLMRPRTLARRLRCESLLNVDVLASGHLFGLSIGRFEDNAFTANGSFFVAEIPRRWVSNARRPRASRRLTETRRCAARSGGSARSPGREAENASLGRRLRSVVVHQSSAGQRRARVARRGGDVEVGVRPKLEDEVTGVDEEEDEGDSTRKAEYGVVLRASESVQSNERVVMRGGRTAI